MNYEGIDHIVECDIDADIATHYINNEFVVMEEPPLPPLTVEEMINNITLAVQKHLDDTARTHNYDNILSLASYAVSTDPVFAAEGAAGAAWRDACWRFCYQALADVQAGTRDMPTPEEAVAELPPIVWPTAPI